MLKRKWTEKEDNWILQNTKGTRTELYERFIKEVPSDKSKDAFFSRRCKLGVSKKVYATKQGRPLYSERFTKGRVFIKVAQPNVWINKAKYVYMQHFPNADYTEPSFYVFLDGDIHNFDINNIAKVPMKLIGIFNKLGGVEKGNPELTKLKILQAKLKSKQLDAGEKIGLVTKHSKNSNSRYFKEERNIRERIRNKDPKLIEKRRKRDRKKLKYMKQFEPEKYQRRLEKLREYHRTHKQTKSKK